MTRDEVVYILRVISASYPTFKPANISETADIWTTILNDQDFEVIKMSLYSYIRTNNSGFAPSIGQLMEYANKTMTQEELTEVQAWGLVMKAIRNSAYNSVEEFSRLPEIIQKAVGSPEQLKSMAIDEAFSESVASSNFMRSYKIVLKREDEMRKYSPEVKQLIDEINKNSPRQLLEQKNKEKIGRLQSNRLIEPRIEYVSMPEDVKQTMKQILDIGE